MFCLVDCNNFYVSCERVFNPRLENKPVVVLSNNDGCVIARSNESKAIGIPMGAPLFEYEKILKQHRAIILSSNYQLYGDMSCRVMETLNHFTPDVEVYSIDEAFLSLNLYSKNWYDFGLEMRRTIYRWVGIPVSVGIAPTKTLAKITNHHAKKKTSAGVYCYNSNTIDDILRELKVTDIWGIGTRMGVHLNNLGIYSALDLKRASPKAIRQHFGVVYERIINELNEIPCFSLEDYVPCKNIMSSRSFPSFLVHLSDIEEALSHFAATACYKARKQGTLAKGMMVFIKTNEFQQGERYYSNSISLTFDEPTYDTRTVIGLAKQALRKIYKPGLKYKKTGILLIDLIDENYKQLSFLDTLTPAPNHRILRALDAINNRYGKNTLFIAAQGIKRKWQILASNRTPRYTTSWNELVNVF